MRGTELIRCEPNLDNFSKSLLSLGYNHYTALLDLIDNSIAAQATKVWIRYKKLGHNLIVVVSDNGIGMSDNQLFAAMRLASADPNSLRLKSEDLGKFGLGMKLASFSISDKFQVISKSEAEQFSSYTWDLEMVRQKNDWILQKNFIDKWFGPDDRPTGTDVILHQVRNEISDLQKVQDRLSYYISTVYYNFKKIEFFIEDKRLMPIDVFFQNHRASNRAAVDTIFHDGVEIKTRSFQIPHRDKLDIRQRDILDGIADIGMSDGIYLFRKNRLIAWSGWEGMGTNKKIGDLQRFAVYIDESADTLFNIEVKKSQINILDDGLRKKLEHKIRIFSNTARRPYKQRAISALKEAINTWKIDQIEGVIQVRIDRSSPAIVNFENNGLSFMDLIDVIEGTLPIDSLLYYLNTGKMDTEEIKRKKIEAAKIMYNNDLISKSDLDKIVAKYE
jgi:hypothetical protein